MLHYLLKIKLKTIVFVFLTTVLLPLAFLIISLYKFEARQSAVTDVVQENVPVLLWWTPFIYENKKEINCGRRNVKCFVTKDRQFKNHTNLSSYLFYGSNLKISDLPLPKSDSVSWAIFHEESPKNLAFFLHSEGQRLFELTSTFSQKSDFPLTLQYLKTLESLTDRTYYVSLNRKNVLLNRGLAPVLYLQSDCDTPIERDYLVGELMKHVNVDSYGECLNNKEMPKKISQEATFEDLYLPELMKFVAQYKFVISFENAECQDYITEKLWRPLIVGSIPIYLGSPTVEDWLPNNNSVILAKNYNNMAELAQHIREINSNDWLYEKFMLHKSGRIENARLKETFEINSYEDDVSTFECFVCQNMHEKFYRLRDDLELIYDCKMPESRDPQNKNWWRWHWTIGKCQSKALTYFLNKMNVSELTQEMFDELYHKYLNENDCG